MSNDIEQLAARLRSLIAEWGPDAAHAIFEQQTAALPREQREHLALLAFGNMTGGDQISTGDISRSTAAIGAGASATNTTQGTVETSGTVHGPAVGVNLGTIIVSPGGATPASGDNQGGQATPEQIAAQHERLSAYRGTLMTLLTQQATLGSAYAPPSVAHGIREARAAIRRIKEVLRGWGVTVEDGPDDVAF